MAIPYTKYIAACALILAGTCCVSCYKSPAGEDDPEENPVVGNSGEQGSANRRLISFQDFTITKMEMSELDQSRAVDAYSSPIHHFLVVDVVDNKIQTVYERHHSEEQQVLNDPVSMDLSYGVHDLYFLCSENQWSNFNPQTLRLTWDNSTEILKDVFAKHLRLKVDANTDSYQTLKMDRCVAYVRVIVNDVLPDNLSTLHLQLNGGCWEYDLVNKTGGVSSQVSRAVSIPVAYDRSSGVSTGIFTFLPEGHKSLESFDVVAWDASGNTLAAKQFTDVPLQVNRYTKFSCTLFGNY